METTIKKNQTAEVKTKNGSSYSYKYVDIAQIHDYLESINAKYIQKIERLDTDDYIMTKRCFNDKWEDEWLQGSRVVDATLFGNDNPAQKQGSALTYARRYSLLMAFGLATEDDDAVALNKEIEITEEYAKTYKLPFGKYKGLTLEECDDDYIVWLLNNSKDEKIIKIIEILTGMVKPTEEEQDERIGLLTEWEKLVLSTNTDREKIYEHYKVENNSQMTNEQLKDSIRIMESKK